jgi:hypothetical protein
MLGTVNQAWFVNTGARAQTPVAWSVYSLSKKSTHFYYVLCSRNPTKCTEIITFSIHNKSE